MKREGGIFDLSHPSRRDMLKLIENKPHRHSELMKTLDISAAETTRHLQRMQESDLIEKTPDNEFKITAYGRLILDELKNLTYLKDHRIFFNTHDMSPIPPELFSIIQLSRSELINGAMPVMGKLYDITDQASIFLWTMMPDPVEPFIRQNVDKLESGVELRLLYNDQSGIPSDFMGKRFFPLEIRSLQEIPMSIWLNEKEGLVMLPDPSGKIDYSMAIHGDEPSYLRWASLLFEHYWLVGRNVGL